MSTEAKFWGRILEALWLPKRKFDRIENGVVDGMPDTYYVMEGVAGWIELKAPAEPARSTTALFSGNHKLSQSQKNWLLGNRQAGGIGFVGIETESYVFLVGARHADAINRWTVDEFMKYSDFAAARPMHQRNWIEFADTLRLQTPALRVKGALP